MFSYCLSVFSHVVWFYLQTKKVYSSWGSASNKHVQNNTCWENVNCFLGITNATATSHYITLIKMMNGCISQTLHTSVHAWDIVALYIPLLSLFMHLSSLHKLESDSLATLVWFSFHVQNSKSHSYDNSDPLSSLKLMKGNSWSIDIPQFHQFPAWVNPFLALYWK